MATRLVAWMCLIAVLLVGTAHADLVGHWNLNEGSGTIAHDSTGNGHDGELIGDPQWVEAQYGMGLEFAGNPDKVDIPYSEQLNPETAFSLSLWTNPDPSGSGHRSPITSRDDFPQRGYIIYIEPGNTWQYWLGIGSWNNTQGPAVTFGEWTHVAATYDNGAKKFYINGELVAEGTGIITPNTQQVLRIGGGATEGNGNYFWVGTIDDVAVFDHSMTDAEVRSAMKGLAPPELASNPIPEAEAVDVPRNVTLGWEPGDFAVKHDVYFGASFEDVNSASVADPLNVLVGPGQDANSYDAGVLDFDQTYYWRVDEVNGAPDNTVFKGDVWSFTVEPYAIPVETITATASSAHSAGMGPEKTIGGIGLNELDQHATDGTTMWLSGMGDPAPTIQYEFDKAYKLDQLLVWNSNQLIEAFVGIGAKDVVIEYSLDGAAWTVLEGATQFNQATGSADYTANTSIDFAGAMAQYVKITVSSGYGIMPQYGISEVRFLYIPTFAREAQPADGAVTGAANVLLSWRAGREAVSHQVKLGTDAQNLDLIATTTEPSYAANGLNYGMTYYWSVTEVNEAAAPAAHAGDIWSFTTPDFGTVDGFDSYDDNCNRIFFAWEDGLGHNGGEGVDDCEVAPSNGNGGGSIVGNAQAPFAEQGIVYSGSQSLPLEYDNAFGQSEATLAIGAQDWTASGVQTLSLQFYGRAGNSGQLYVKINSTKVVYDGQAADIALAQWQPWNIDLTALTGLQNVTQLTIGLDGANAAGLLYIDAIRLYPQALEFINPTDPGAANLVAQYAFEGDYTDSVGGHNATEMGMPQIISDPTRGQVLSLAGGGDALDIPYSAALNPPAFTASLWALVNPNGSGYRSPITSRDDGPQRGYIIYVTPGNVWQFWTGPGWDGISGPAAVMDEWTHVGITYANDQKTLYINGRLAAEGTATMDLNTAQPLRIGGGATESPNGDFFFVGLIDDVRIYNQALSAAELAWLADIRTPLHKPL